MSSSRAAVAATPLVDDPLNILREVGTPAALRIAAMPLPRAAPDHNTHLHLPPNFSAFTTVAEAMELADAQNCRVVGASNYYDYKAYFEFATQARRHNVFPLFGLEIICMIDDLRAAGTKINDPVNPGKMYICGKGIARFARMSPEADRILNIIRGTDARRTAELVGRVSHILAERGLPNAIHADAVIDMVVRRHSVPRETVFLQERHVAQAFQEFIFTEIPSARRLATLQALLGAAPRIQSPDDFVGVQNELRAHLMKAGKIAYVNETFIDFAPAMRLISELGGFACYPLLADATDRICPFERTPDELAANLKQRGIYAAEFIANRNAPELIERYTKVLRRAGIVVTAGTEHNLLEMIPMEPHCLGGVPISPDLRAVFYEGACVMAAHQFLTAHGETGYVDDAGRPNPEFPDADTRIGSLASLGDAVIRGYLNKGTPR